MTVRVQDLNDYTPVFNNIPLIANVKENQPAGTYVLNITVEDEDRGYNAATEIFLLDVCTAAALSAATVEFVC